MARQRMIQTIQEIRKEGSIRLLISSHLLRDIDETCDEVLILKDGRIAALCNIEEERRSNRNFIELETVGATDRVLRTPARAGLRVRILPWRARQARHARHHRSPRSSMSSHPKTERQIRRINRRRDSLEDIFLRAMESEPAEGGTCPSYKHEYRAYTGPVTPLPVAHRCAGALRAC